MLPLEIASAVLSSGAAVSLMSPRGAKIAKYLSAGSLLSILAQSLFEGAHWQIAGEYIAAITVCAIAFAPSQSRLSRTVAAVLSLMFAGSAVILSVLLPIFTLPRPTGPYPVGTTTLYLNDHTDQEDRATDGSSTRELKVQFWYPAKESNRPFARYRELKETEPLSRYQWLVRTNSHLDAPLADSRAPFPVILFNPGWDSRRTIDTFLTEDLASHGYVVVATDHPYNARLVSLRDGRVISGSASPGIASPESSTPESIVSDWNHELATWENDERFVLDQLQSLDRNPQSFWFGKIDAENAGAVGHSFGGAVGAMLCAHDSRVHGAVNMDGWFFRAIQDRGPGQPLMVMDSATSLRRTGNEDTVAGKLNASDAANVMSSLQRFGGYLVLLNGAHHDDFTDENMVSPLRVLAHRGTIPPSELQSIVRTYVLAFFDKTLRGKDSSILNESSPFQQVSITRWPPAEAAQRNIAEVVPHRVP